MLNEASRRRLRSARQAARALRGVSTDCKNEVLKEAALLLRARAATVLAANQRDLAALGEGSASAFRDRLALDRTRLAQMVDGLEVVASLRDPVGEETESRVLRNGLRVRRVRASLGLIFMIFESRPNVAIEAWSLAFKAGNAIILRGGKESARTTEVLYAVMTDALSAKGLPADCVWGVTDPDRALALSLLQCDRDIDVVVPRGGEGLIKFVSENSRIPIIKNDRGLCHVYAHEDADIEMAAKIVLNAKCQRPGVCNAIETLLVHAKVAAHLLPLIHDRLSPSGVEWFGCAETMALLRDRPGVHAAGASSYDTEYLDLKLSCRIVSSLDEAVEHIERHGSRHSESIVTASEKVARDFQSRVDAAAVYWNASTRFTDGYELGLGGELGISTQKLHVRGPIGLRELTSARWLIDGDGQIRGNG